MKEGKKLVKMILRVWWILFHCARGHDLCNECTGRCTVATVHRSLHSLQSLQRSSFFTWKIPYLVWFIRRQGYQPINRCIQSKRLCNGQFDWLHVVKPISGSGFAFSAIWLVDSEYCNVCNDCTNRCKAILIDLQWIPPIRRSVYPFLAL